MRKHLPNILVFAVTAAIYLTGGLDWAEYALMELRFKLTPRAASGDLVVVEIDARSLDELGVWPWPREFHASVIDRLVEAGAQRIAFDIDFSARSTAESDRSLTEALNRAGDRTVLPVFRQIATAPGTNTEVLENLPLPDFRQHARLATVNVLPDGDSQVRWFATNVQWNDHTVPTMPVELAGRALPDANGFYVDFGIQVSSLRRVSFVDVLLRRLPPETFSGKRVLIGASAIELGDNLPVPIYRALPGVVLQALAYESLEHGRAIQRSGELPTLLVTLILTLLLGRRFHTWTWRRGGIAVLGVVAASSTASYWIQAVLPVSLDIASWITVTALSFLAAQPRKLDEQARQLFIAHAARIHRQQMMTSVVEDSFDGIVLTDDKGQVKIINRAATSMLGRGAEDLLGTDIESVLPAWPSLVEQAGETLELTVERLDGVTIDIELVVSASLLQPRKHRLERRLTPRTVYVHTFRNITERKRVEQLQEQALNEAQAASRAKSELITNMSHELRTPLNAINGFSELIKDQMLGPVGNDQYLDYAQDIHASGTHLLEVINDILDLAKAEAGNLELDETRVDVARTVAACVRIVGGRRDAQGVRIATDLPSDLPLLHADERVLKQILLNVISNAAKFTDAGGDVRIMAGIVAGGGLSITVADTGIGIAEEEIEKLTEPFYQVDSGLQRKYEGTGLGLHLVKSYLALHGATLSIDGKLGSGTTVILAFPGSRTVCDNIEAEQSRDHPIAAV